MWTDETADTRAPTVRTPSSPPDGWIVAQAIHDTVEPIRRT
jgi:hypothetical protein